MNDEHILVRDAQSVTEAARDEIFFDIPDNSKLFGEELLFLREMTKYLAVKACEDNGKKAPLKYKIFPATTVLATKLTALPPSSKRELNQVINLLFKSGLKAIKDYLKVRGLPKLTEEESSHLNAWKNNLVEDYSKHITKPEKVITPESRKIAILIREAREKKNLTLVELANKIGVVKSTIWKWERGQSVRMQRNLIGRVAKVLDLDPTLFLTTDNEENSEKPSLLKFYVFDDDMAGARIRNGDIVYIDAKAPLVDGCIIAIQFVDGYKTLRTWREPNMLDTKRDVALAVVHSKTGERYINFNDPNSRNETIFVPEDSEILGVVVKNVIYYNGRKD